MRRIFDRVLIVGRANYSPWVAAQDTRDMAKEMSDESLDRAIYGAMDDVRREDERKQRRLCNIADRQEAALQSLMESPVVDVRSSFVVDEFGVHEILMGGR